jgi:plasmid stabilization system protein ParE
MRGVLRDDIRQGLRVFGFRRRISIAFEISADTVTILGVFYGGQSIDAAFEE